MRILARWTTRFVLAAAAGVAIAVGGAAVAQADDESTGNPPAASTPSTAPSESGGTLNNFPWG
ncbi:hypothetical protein AB0G04_41115 [Actinoplanes sp. NPDC023801]|uniref:hypothetical protein n=1 Tax=Actinoplanes sp. NPDC023801 TaxID=3154595 RepID=UPI0033CBDFDF